MGKVDAGISESDDHARSIEDATWSHAPRGNLSREARRIRYSDETRGGVEEQTQRWRDFDGELWMCRRESNDSGGCVPQARDSWCDFAEPESASRNADRKPHECADPLRLRGRKSPRRSGAEESDELCAVGNRSRLSGLGQGRERHARDHRRKRARDTDPNPGALHPSWLDG